MSFWEAHEKDRDKFAILTFHETSRAATLREIEPQIQRLEKDVWGKKLPFPVLVDASGDTIKKWKVTAYPTLVLIDPEGVVHYVQVGGNPKFEKLLETKVKEMAAKAPGDGEKRAGPAATRPANGDEAPRKPNP